MTTIVSKLLGNGHDGETTFELLELIKLSNEDTEICCIRDGEETICYPRNQSITSQEQADLWAMSIIN